VTSRLSNSRGRRMNKQEFMVYHRRVCEAMHETAKKKNADYTGASNDPFANFRQIGSLVQVEGIDINIIGFITRMSDKLSRLASFAAQGTYQVSDETFTDTCLDLANYAILLAGYQHGERVPKLKDRPRRAGVRHGRG
jgi:hypothetical protein